MLSFSHVTQLDGRPLLCPAEKRIFATDFIASIYYHPQQENLMRAIWSVETSPLRDL